jgi:N-acetylneuraminic acid mutarotase
MHIARSSLGAAVVDGEIYAIGGVLDPPSYVTCTGANEKYDLANNQWTFRTAMPTARASFAVAAVEGKIYCIGGTTGLDNGQVVVCSVNEVYDPALDKWETKTSMPTARVGASASVFDGKIYVIGGDSNATEVYDPKTDSWTTKSAMPVKPGLRMLWSCASAVLDGKIHVFGASPYSASNQIYDPQNDSWSDGAPIVQGYLLATATKTLSGNVWVFGVDNTWWDSGPPKFTSLTFDAFAGCWRVSSLMATPRVNAAVARVGESVYVIGGSMVMIENNAHPTAIVEQYTPQSDQPSDKQPPKITVLSPKDQAYLPNLTVEFTTNKPIGSIQLGIDGKSLISVSGNTSISLQQGKHNLTVYAVDYFGNIGASDTVTFTVSETIDTPFPLSIVAAVGFLFLVAGIVLVWVFFGRKKEKTSEREG